MQTFTDNANRKWALSIDVNAIRRVVKIVGIDLTKPDEGSPPLAVRLDTEVMLLCDVLYALVMPDAMAANPPVSDEEFGRGLGGEGLRFGKEALTAEMVDFFSRWGRPELVQALKSQAKLSGMVQARSLRQLESLDLEELLNRSESEYKRDQARKGQSPSGSEFTS